MSSGSDVSVADLRMHVLGRLDLQVGGEDAGRVLAQPRRLALLLYLVLRRPGGYLTRDHLLGVFWPDSPEKQARDSLRQAVRFLRQSLGAGRLRGRGGNLGVEPAGLKCDVLAFQRALEEGRLEAALAFYGGDLLPGYFFPDAPEGQRWLDAERVRLRTAARHAALTVSETAETHDPEVATRFARRALALEPTHEPAVRQLIRLLARFGDRAGAVETYEAFAGTMRKDLDLEPSPETQELVERVRHAELARNDAAGGATSADPPVSTHAWIPKAERRRVVVFPFENLTGDPGLDVLGRMVVDSLSRGLSDTRELEVAPPSGSSTDASHGASIVVEGGYYREGNRGHDRLLLQARLTDVANDRLLPGPEPIIVPREEPLEGLVELTRMITAILAPALNPRATHVYHGARPPSFEVYRAYMEGLESFIAGDWIEAATRLRHCAEGAPEYALPRIVWAIAEWNLGRLHEAAEIVAEVAALRDTIGRFERCVLDTVRAWLAGDWATALGAVRLQSEMAPGSIPSFQVAEEARRLNRLREAREVLAALDPEQGELRGWIHYWVELTTVLHLLGDHEAELEAAGRARRIHPDDPMSSWLEIAALAALGRIGELELRIDEAATLTGGRHPRPGRWLHDAARELWRHGHDEAASLTLERSLAWFGPHVDGHADPTASLRRDYVRALYDAKRWEAAGTILRRLVEEAAPGEVQALSGHHGHLCGHCDEGYLAAIAWHQADEAELARWRRRLERMGRRFLFGADRLWIGKLALFEGDEAGAAAEIRRALAEGLPFGMHLHADPDLAPLRESVRFRALMRPRDL